MGNDHKYSLPEKGVNRENLINELEEARSADVGWKEGRSFGLVYRAGDNLDKVIRDVYTHYIHSNALDPKAFPSLKKFETEVVSATANLLNAGENAVGTVTSGGSESQLLAVKSSRDQARSERSKVGNPEIIMPASAHPSLDKAAHYLGVKVVRIPLDEDFKADLDAVRQAINPNTIMLVGSAPAYPHGVVDPIKEMGALAVENNINLHVDASLGGYMLPFMERLGYRIPPFDFRVPGVTSISADLHKYGFAAKGASTGIAVTGCAWKTGRGSATWKASPMYAANAKWGYRARRRFQKQEKKETTFGSGWNACFKKPYIANNQLSLQ